MMGNSILDVFAEGSGEIEEIEEIEDLYNKDHLIRKYNLDSNNETVMKNFDLCLKAEKQMIDDLYHLFTEGWFKDAVTTDRQRIGNLIRRVREKIFNNESLSFKFFPTQSNLVQILYATYKTEVDTKSLGMISAQSARPCMTLTNKNGCLFVKSNVDSKNNVIYKKDKRKTQYRCIADFDPTFCGDIYSYSDNYIKCSVKKLKEYEKDKKCPITGKKRGLERDHRIPVMACRDLGIVPAIIVPEDLITGEIENNFQWMHREHNVLKRSSCEKCLRGDKIKVPPFVEEKQRRGIYISHWCGDCTLCYWYDVASANK